MADNSSVKEKKLTPVDVSVIIPCFNAAHTVRKAIDSVLEQDVNLELILLDDCSKDDTGTVLSLYNGDPRVRIVLNKQNLGASGSRNKGVSMARGAYIAFLDADDYWSPGKLSRQLELLRKTGNVLCCTARELMTTDGKCTGRIIPVREVITYRALLQHNSINCSSVVVRKEAILRFPMEHEDSHEDYITWLKILKNYGPAIAINEPMLKYRLSSGGKSGNKFKSAAMTFKVYRYMGFGRARSIVYFISYAVHGVWKYLRA